MWGLRLWHDVGIARPEARAMSTSTVAKEKPRSAASGAMYRPMTSAVKGPTRAISHRARGVTVTDWRLHTADHRHIDGGGNKEAIRRR